MRSKTRSVKIPHSICDAGDHRARALGYVSLNAYIVSLMRYDLLVRCPHHLTLPVARMRIEQQDMIDDHLLKLEGKSRKDQEAFFNSLVKQLMGEGVSLEICPACHRV
jgi:hypothetical protein